MRVRGTYLDPFLAQPLDLRLGGGNGALRLRHTHKASSVGGRRARSTVSHRRVETSAPRRMVQNVVRFTVGGHIGMRRCGTPGGRAANTTIDTACRHKSITLYASGLLAAGWRTCLRSSACWALSLAL
eukprot:scaffold10955_cov125-Isochrysis_galbana.AAC.2